MKTVEEILKPIQEITADIPAAVKAIKAKGKKVIGVFPIYAPEEIIYAAGMHPVGCWGGQVTIAKAAALLPPFACPVMQGITELSMSGCYNLLDGAIISTPCDTLKCLTQNFMRTTEGVKPIFISYPQNNRLEGGRIYLYKQLKDTARQLEEIAGVKITEQALHESIEIYNENRAAMMHLTKLLGEKPGAITAQERHIVMKARWFMDKKEHTKAVNELCEVIEAKEVKNTGVKVILAGIMTEPADFVQILDELGMTVVGDELAYESRQFRNPVPQDIDQYERLALQWKNVEGCSVVFDPEGNRAKTIINMAEKYNADGILYCQMKFCEEEEFDYPYIKNAAEAAEIPILNIEIDPLSTSKEQLRTRLQAFAEQIQMTV